MHWGKPFYQSFALVSFDFKFFLKSSESKNPFRDVSKQGGNGVAL